MKKREDGYILLYVLIVIVLLCLVATSICTIALRNFQAQQASVARTRQLYTAEGQVERFVAAVRAKSVGLTNTEIHALDSVHAVDNGRAGFLKALDELEPLEGLEASVLNAEGAETPWQPEDEEHGAHWCKIAVRSTAGDLVIDAELAAALTIEPRDVTQEPPEGEGEPEPALPQYTYEITGCSITYADYGISNAEAGEAG